MPLKLVLGLVALLLTFPAHLPSAGAAATATLSYDGKIRDRVGQSNTGLSADGQPDGTFTVTLGAGSGSRTVTRLELRNTVGGTWDTAPETIFWTLGVASGPDGALFPSDRTPLNVVVADGASLTLFAADWRDAMFTNGSVLTLAMMFADGTSAIASTTVNVRAASVALRYDGQLRDTVGQNNGASAADGWLDGTFTLTLGESSGTRTITNLELRSSAGGVWDTSSATPYWTLGVASRPSGALLQNGSDAVNVVLAAGAAVTLYAADWKDEMFANGTVFTVLASFADGSTAVATTTVGATAPPAITTQPAPATVTAPAAATFSVSATGAAPLGYQWQKNNVDIAGATGSTYTTPATSTGDSGSAFRVVITNGAGSITSTAAALTVRAAPDVTPPSTPGTPTISSSTCGQVTLSWGASTDAGGSGLKGYNVYRDGALVKLVGATSTSDAGLSASTTYAYTVAAVDNAGNASVPSAATRVTPAACPDTAAPSVPTGVTAAAASCSQIPLNWTASTDTGGSGLKGYNVYRNGVLVGQAPAPATAATDPGLAASSTYTYRMTALDNAGNESALSAPVSATTPACEASTPALIGFVPGIGTARDVVIDEATGLAFVASGEFGLAVADVSNPGAPVVIGAANPPFYGQRLALDGPLAVVTGSTLGLRVVDVSAPRTPKTVGALDGTMLGVAMAGEYAYVLLGVPGNPGPDLAVIDLHDPAAPTIAGRVALAGGVSLRVAGSLVYVAAAGAGLQIVDVSNPAAPWIRSTLDTPGGAKGVAAGNGYAYVADNTSIQIVRVSTPASPVVVGSVAAAAATAVALSGSRLYAIDGTMLKIIDVSNPAAPVVLGASDNRGAQGIDAQGTRVFLASPSVDASKNKGGLYVVDAAVPSAPVVLANAYGGFENKGVAVSGSLGVVTGSTLGLKVVDVSEPTAPRVVSSMSGTMTGVAMAGRYAYVLVSVAGSTGPDLAVVDLGLPASPTIVGRVALAGGMSVRVVGTLAYVAAGGAGLQIVDVSNPAAPWIRSTLDTPGGAKGVAVAGGVAYVADNTSVQVVNVAAPGAPAVVTSIPAGATSAVAVVGARLYVLDGTQFKIFDVTSPAAPALLSVTSSYSAQAFDVAGSLAFLAKPALNHTDPTGGIYVVDVSTPARPELVDLIDVPGTTRTVVATPDYVYAGDSAAIIDVIGR